MQQGSFRGRFEIWPSQNATEVVYTHTMALQKEYLSIKFNSASINNAEAKH